MVVSKAFKKILFLTSLAFLLFFCIKTGYSLGKSETDLEDISQAKEVSAVENFDVITNNTIISKTHVFKKCGHQITVEEEPGPDMLGLNVISFMDRFNRFAVIDFTGEAVTLKISIDNYCDKHYILKTLGSRVMVFNYDILNGDYVVVKKTPLTLTDLDADTLRILDRGKIFNSLGDINTYIDGIKKD